MSAEPAKLPVKQAAISRLVDELAEVKANISRLEEREKEITEEMKMHGPGLYKGSLFEVNVFESSRSTTNWKELSVYFKIPAKIVEKFTTTKDILVCKLQPRSAR